MGELIQIDISLKLIALIIAVTLIFSATFLAYVGRISPEQYMQVITSVLTLVATLGGVAVYTYVRERLFKEAIQG
jgi:VIT1/CCC1 family predicted Fe2+/Mn2+ transporter